MIIKLTIPGAAAHDEFLNDVIEYCAGPPRVHLLLKALIATITQNVHPDQQQSFFDCYLEGYPRSHSTGRGEINLQIEIKTPDLHGLQDAIREASIIASHWASDLDDDDVCANLPVFIALCTIIADDVPIDEQQAHLDDLLASL